MESERSQIGRLLNRGNTGWARVVQGSQTGCFSFFLALDYYWHQKIRIIQRLVKLASLYEMCAMAWAPPSPPSLFALTATHPPAFQPHLQPAPASFLGLTLRPYLRSM